MSEDPLQVERVFPVGFLDGPIVWGTVTGCLAEHDRVFVERPDGARVTGRVVAIDHNRPADAREDQFGIAVGGELGRVVRVGDVVRKLPS